MKKYDNLKFIGKYFSTLLALFFCYVAHADDIDIYTGMSAGIGQNPNVIFLIDNSPNWSRQAQKWPDANMTQGEAELAAIANVIDIFSGYSTIPNMGLAMLNEYAGSTVGQKGGGYIRFAVRDMTVANNKSSLKNILALIKSRINDPTEKLGGMASKEETAGFYEIYKYLSGLTPYTGDFLHNPYVDIGTNNSIYSAKGQGITSGFAIGSDGKYVSPITTTNSCAKTFIIYIANNANNTGSSGLYAYEPLIANTAPALTPTAGLDTTTDEWTKFLYTNGVVVPAGNTNGSVVTYVLDAYNAQQNVGYSNSLKNAALVGGGRYFQVGSQAAIQAALIQILVEIQSINSTFASASLPVNTTNRTQNKNQVFIPMFRPDANAYPLWRGNLKQYQFISNGTNVLLGDSNGQEAISPLTGFPTDCATSFWTTDSGSYWYNVISSISLKSQCATTTYDLFSDAPDGPFVEKGGVAEVIRRGNNPPITTTTPTYAVNRTIYTRSGNNLVTFNTTNTGLSSNLVNFIRGQDINDENINGNTTETRASIHGDAIHSQPLALDYGGTTGVIVYYGANDGLLRAVDSANGKELWGYIAPESFSTLGRLLVNSPQVSYPNMPAGIIPTPTPKDYFFDGSIGVYQTATNSSVWIYPAMRRGGRMIHAFDVTNPMSPSLKWAVGCPRFSDNTGCSSGFSGIGQTWSTPNVANAVLGYSGPVVLVGGGYDTCEDANTATPSCTSPKGALVYVLDAHNGNIIKSFTTERSVVADVALIATSSPTVVNHAYAVDTGGNIYRIDFASSVNDWSMRRIAHTTGAGRKFLFRPALLLAPNGKVYLALGSGDREHPLQSQYPFSAVVNRFYVLLDDMSSADVDLDSMLNYTNATNCDSEGVLPTLSNKGWFMDLNQYGQGEQTVTTAIIAGGMVNFSTNRPIPANSGSCSTALGQARGYTVSLFNGSGSIGVSGVCGGSRSSIFVGGGLPPSPVFVTVPIDGKPTMVMIGTAQKSGGASTPISPQQITPSVSSKRKTLYWKSN